MQRGVIRNRNHAAQIRDFSGLKFGSITPTDIDLMIEYRNLGYVYGELKYKGAELPAGQRLALERQCDDMSKVKKTIGIIAHHESSGDIDAAAAIVSEYRWGGKWHMSDGKTTVKDLIDRFTKYLDFDKHGD